MDKTIGTFSGDFWSVKMDLSFKDAAAAACALHRGRDTSLASRLDFWVSLFGDRPLTSVTKDDVEDGIDQLVAKPKMMHIRGKGMVDTGETISPSTCNRYIAALGTMYRLLKAARKLPRGFNSPMIRVTRLEESEGRTLQITTEQVRHLVAAARLTRNRKLSALIAVGCTTGLRMGALKALTWKDVDLKARTLDVERTKNGRPTRSVLPVWVVEELERMRPKLATDGDLIFGPRDCRKAWQSALDMAGLPADWTPHHMRHIAASVLAQSGASLPVIMQALNHRTPMMAMRYAHVNTSALKQAVQGAWS